jgi:hypothetical protein
VTFLNPYILFGLIAASFPVLFHFFAQRRARRIEFSSIRFLKQLEKSSMRKIKIRQILLLILRTLLIIFLVFAFARPALRGYLGGFFGASSANSTIVVLLDNSASMGKRNASGTYIKQAQDAALKVTDMLREGDEVVIIPIAESRGGEKQYTPLHDKQEIRKAISDIRLADASARVPEALRLASSVFAKSLNINKEMFLITDDQSHNFEPDEKQDTSHLRLFDERTKLYVMEIGKGDAAEKNLSIDSLKSLTTIFEPGRQIDFEVFVRNTGSSDVETSTLSLFFNEQRVAQKSLDKISSGETKRIVISALPRSVGQIAVRSELEDDVLPFDNKRYLTVNIPASRRVGIFFDGADKAKYLALALEQTISEQATAPYQIELHRTEELRMLPSLERLDAIMIGIGKEQIEPSDVKALKEYLAKGRGASLFLLADIDIKSYNASFAPALGLPLVSGKHTFEPGKYSSFTQFDLAHPFFQGMFEEKANAAKGIESPKFTSYRDLASGGIPLVSLAGGGSFLSEYSVGKGNMLIYSVSPDFEESDLPAKSIFLPLVRRTAAYLASLSAQAKAEGAAGDIYTDSPAELAPAEIQSEQPGTSLLLKSPDGSSRRVQTVGSASGAIRLSLPSLSQAGIYTLYKDAEMRSPLVQFAVNVRSKEADLTRASRAEIEKILTPYFASSKEPILMLDASKDDIEKTVKQSRYGVELWQTFLMLALLCGILEMLVAREGKIRTKQ